MQYNIAEGDSRPHSPQLMGQRQEYPHAFKVLAPDTLTAGILGNKGAGIQEIQTTTNTKISISNREERFPSTNCRLVLIRGHQASAIDLALQAICHKLKEVAQGPLKSEEDKAEMMSAKGDFKLRVVMLKGAAGAMIGPKGANIAKMREQTGCRIRVEDARVGYGETSEQIVSLLGSIDTIIACVSKLNNLIQEFSEQEYFAGWAHLKCNTPQPGMISPNGQPQINSKGQGKGYPPSGQDMYGGYGGQMVHQHQGGYGGSMGYGGSPDDMLSQVLASMPHKLVANRTFAVQASLPIESMSALIGKRGSHTKQIQHETGAKVSLRDEDPNAVVTIEGHLHSVLAGYCMVMKKYLEIEAQG